MAEAPDRTDNSKLDHTANNDNGVDCRKRENHRATQASTVCNLRIMTPEKSRKCAQEPPELSEKLYR